MILNKKIKNEKIRSKNMKYVLILICAVALLSCSESGKKSSAYGNFEAVEVLVSSEVAGKLLSFELEEGATLDSGRTVGRIDSVQTLLNLRQAEAQKESISSKYAFVIAQANVYRQQKANAEKDFARISKMFAEKSATQKQLDDITGVLALADKQINQIESQNATIFTDLKSLSAQIDRLKDLLAKCTIINPIKGVVLAKYSQASEVVSPAKPLYKIADLDNIILRVYVSGAQVGDLKIGQTVRVLVDKNATENRETEGVISWISSKAEFTPKIIQTKDERVKMVYAVKIKVKNDGSLKIGMPGEVAF
jgi:HlyD family secretion protein